MQRISSLRCPNKTPLNFSSGLSTEEGFVCFDNCPAQVGGRLMVEQCSIEGATFIQLPIPECESLTERIFEK